jgi:hypothetical protein
VRGGPVPVRRFLPGLIDQVCNREIEPGKVFDLTLPLDQVAEGYRAMDERRAIKTLLRPQAISWARCDVYQNRECGLSALQSEMQPQGG